MRLAARRCTTADLRKQRKLRRQSRNASQPSRKKIKRLHRRKATSKSPAATPHPTPTPPPRPRDRRQNLQPKPSPRKKGVAKAERDASERRNHGLKRRQREKRNSQRMTADKKDKTAQPEPKRIDRRDCGDWNQATGSEKGRRLATAKLVRQHVARSFLSRLEPAADRGRQRSQSFRRWRGFGLKRMAAFPISKS